MLQFDWLRELMIIFHEKKNLWPYSMDGVQLMGNYLEILLFSTGKSP